MSAEGLKSSDGANDLGFTEILALVIFGAPTLLSVGLVWLKNFRRAAVRWLDQHDLLTRNPFIEIPGTQGFGPTIRGAALVIGLLLLLVGVGAVGVVRARQRTGLTRAPAN